MEEFEQWDTGNVTDRIYREIIRLRSEGEAAALATVVRTVGSTPGKALFKMLIYPDGKILGSVGGGIVEVKVISKALEAIKNQEPDQFEFKLMECDGVMTDDQPICGGSMEVFIEPITVNPKLYIMGAGHVGQALARIGKIAGFRVVVVDDRKEFIDKEKLSDSDEVRLLDFKKVADEIIVNQSSYIVIVTRGHQYDENVLKAFIKSKAAYIGMIGSKRKVNEVFQSLINAGIEKEFIDRVHAPIGLDIGAQTPSEIAVSIMAEIIAHKYGKNLKNVVSLS